MHTAQVIVMATFVVQQLGANLDGNYIYICTISVEMEDSEPATCIRELLKLGSGCYGVDRRCGGAEVKGVTGLVESGVETEIRS